MRLGIILTIGLVLLSSVSCMKKRVTGLQKDTRSLLDPSVGDPTICPSGMSASISPQGGTSFPVGTAVTFNILASGCNFGYGVSFDGGNTYQPFLNGNSTQVTVPQNFAAQTGRQQRFQLVAYANFTRSQIGRGPFAFYSTPFDLTGEQGTVSFEPQGSVQVVANQVEFHVVTTSPISIEGIESSESGYIQTPVYSLSGEPPVQTAVSYRLDVTDRKKFRVKLNRGVPGNSGTITVRYKKYNGSTLGTTVLTNTIITSHNALGDNYRSDFSGQGNDQNLLYDPTNGNIFWSYDNSPYFQSYFGVPQGETLKQLLIGQIDNQVGSDLLFVTNLGSGTSQQAKFYLMKSNLVSEGSSTGVNFGSAISCGVWSGAPINPSFSLGPISELRSNPVVYYMNAQNQILESRITVNGSTCSLSPAAEASTITVTVTPKVALTTNEQICSGREMQIEWSVRNLRNYDSCRLFAKVGNTEESIGSASVPIVGGAISRQTASHRITANTDYTVECFRGIDIKRQSSRQNLGTPCVTYSAATGGTVTDYTEGTGTSAVRYRAHTFTSSGTLNVTSNSGPFEVLIVAGGGGGGSGNTAGGGGGGGVFHKTDFMATQGDITVTVGAGGAVSTKGGDSSLGTLIAKGGGKGGNNKQAGGSGGSGGGGGTKDVLGGAVEIAGQGNAGGRARQHNWSAGGGGGGAGAVGQNGGTWESSQCPRGYPSCGHGGAGGAGIVKNLLGRTQNSEVTYAGGGGACGEHRNGAGGTGGGGAGKQPGVANTGGGGGCGAAGGSGIVIVRYRIAPAQ